MKILKSKNFGSNTSFVFKELPSTDPALAEMRNSCEAVGLELDALKGECVVGGDKSVENSLPELKTVPTGLSGLGEAIIQADYADAERNFKAWADEFSDTVRYREDLAIFELKSDSSIGISAFKSGVEGGWPITRDELINFIKSNSVTPTLAETRISIDNTYDSWAKRLPGVNYIPGSVEGTGRFEYNNKNLTWYGDVPTSFDDLSRALKQAKHRENELHAKDLNILIRRLIKDYNDSQADENNKVRAAASYDKKNSEIVITIQDYSGMGFREYFETFDADSVDALNLQLKMNEVLEGYERLAKDEAIKEPVVAPSEPVVVTASSEKPAEIESITDEENEARGEQIKALVKGTGAIYDSTLEQVTYSGATLSVLDETGTYIPPAQVTEFIETEKVSDQSNEALVPTLEENLDLILAPLGNAKHLKSKLSYNAETNEFEIEITDGTFAKRLTLSSEEAVLDFDRQVNQALKSVIFKNLGTSKHGSNYAVISNPDALAALHELGEGNITGKGFDVELNTGFKINAASAKSLAKLSKAYEERANGLWLEVENASPQEVQNLLDAGVKVNLISFRALPSVQTLTALRQLPDLTQLSISAEMTEDQVMQALAAIRKIENLNSINFYQAKPSNRVKQAVESLATEKGSLRVNFGSVYYPKYNPVGFNSESGWE